MFQHDYVAPEKSVVSRQSFRKRSIQKSVLSKFKKGGATKIVNHSPGDYQNTGVKKLSDLLEKEKVDKGVSVKKSVQGKTTLVEMPSFKNTACIARRLVLEFTGYKVQKFNKLKPVTWFLFNDLVMDCDGWSDNDEFTKTGSGQNKNDCWLTGPRILPIIEVSISMMPPVQIEMSDGSSNKMFCIFIGSSAKSYEILYPDESQSLEIFNQLAESIEIRKARHYRGARPVPKPVAGAWHYSEFCVLCLADFGLNGGYRGDLNGENDNNTFDDKNTEKTNPSQSSKLSTFFDKMSTSTKKLFKVKNSNFIYSCSVCRQPVCKACFRSSRCLLCSNS